jgi:hypothetical protein
MAFPSEASAALVMAAPVREDSARVNPRAAGEHDKAIPS